MTKLSKHRPTPPLLYVEDDERARRATLALLSLEVPVLATGSVGEAINVARLNPLLLGAVVDDGLPDGSGIQAISVLRRYHEDLPILVLTGNVHEEQMVRAQLVGAEFLPKPAPAKNLLLFLERCQSRLDPVAAFAVEYALSSRETELVRLASQGRSHKELALALGVSESTVRSYMSRVRVKTRHGSFSSVLSAVRNDD